MITHFRTRKSLKHTLKRQGIYRFPHQVKETDEGFHAHYVCNNDDDAEQIANLGHSSEVRGS